jgi:hypothetical protein
MKMSLMTDEHSPDMFRVNGPLSQNADFAVSLPRICGTIVGWQQGGQWLGQIPCFVYVCTRHSLCYYSLSMSQHKKFMLCIP